MYLMPKRKRGLDGSKENTVWNKPFFWLFKMKIHLSKPWCTFLFCPRNLTELSIDDEHNLLNGADQTVGSRTNSRRTRESPLSKGYYVLTRRVKGKWKQSSESYWKLYMIRQLYLSWCLCLSHHLEKLEMCIVGFLKILFCFFFPQSRQASGLITLN